MGKIAELVGVATVTYMSHARDTRMNRERNKRFFFIIVLCMVNLLSYPMIATRNEKLPTSRAFSLSKWTVWSSGYDMQTGADEIAFGYNLTPEKDPSAFGCHNANQ
ncbi:MAG TPA: hypothetical protein VK206_20810 [Anaerolineales bacterium]|nr:hypothetical protein [Anaerolineales bacterium]